MAKEFVVIETQEQFDAAISARIGALTSKHNEATAELQKQIEALKTENQNLSKGVEEGKTKEKLLETIYKKIRIDSCFVSRKKPKKHKFFLFCA